MVYVPIISNLSHRLYPRKGGGKGGGGKGGSSGGSSGKGGSSSSKGGSSGKPSAVPISGKTGSPSKSSASAYGGGGGKPTVIPSGQLFAGRSVGGGSRGQVWGSRTYGSGYPYGYPAGYLGVGGLGFPFYFWPVVWGAGFGYGGAYLYDSEFGQPSNPDRPGGIMMEATFSSGASNSTFHVLADNSTVVSLITSVTANCTSFNLNVNASSTSPSSYNSSDPFEPRPEQVVQYYRASSVVLTLDGYNDTTALLQNNTGVPDVPIPSWVDPTLLDCLNQTIGLAVPLIDGASSWRTPGAGLLALVWVAYVSVMRI